jgi:hypothetical protein
MLNIFLAAISCLAIVSCGDSKTERIETGEHAGELTSKPEMKKSKLYKRFDYEFYHPRDFQHDKNKKHRVTRNYFSERGMEYVVYYGNGVFVVNLTKDSLEIELINKQLQN